MTGDDLLAEAIADLYSADPEEFMHRRQELAGRARSAGQAVVAKQITALRKPTRSAWMINQLARSDPDATARLTELGDELRAVERSGDGRRLRELSQTRRQLVATLVRRVLEVSGQDSMPAAVREEITATFAAALADTEVAEQIRHGALVRAERWSGFGTAHAPTLTVVPPLPDSHRAAKIKPKPKTNAPMAVTPTPSAATTKDRTHTPADHSATAGRQAATAGRQAATAGRQAATTGHQAPTAGDQTRTAGDLAPATRAETAAARAERAAERAEQAAAEAKAAQERRKAKVRAKAEEALAKADQAVTDAAQEQQEQEKAIRRLERELARARSGLRAAVADARRAEAVQRKARQALARLPD